MDEAPDTPPTDGIAYDPASKLFVQRRVAAHTPDSTALLKFFRVAKTPWVYTVLCGKTGNRNPG